jgi:SAM-dependent methyltransferase
MVREKLSRGSLLRKAHSHGQAIRRALVDSAWAKVDFERFPAAAAVRIAYQIMLRRDPDPTGFANYVAQVSSGTMSRADLIQIVRASEEFQTLGFPGSMMVPSIHAGRCEFIKSLPRAQRIVDLGGTHLGQDVGALVSLGYPYTFDELTIIDLPSADRHEIYRATDARTTVPSPLGPVTYRYHSMTDLSGFADASVDLVYSGQSIEHVSPDEARVVVAETERILRPGGYLAIDTPNARVTRIQQDAFIDPDHKVEYTWNELRALLTSAGLEVAVAQGLNYAPRSVATGTFDPDEVARHWGLHHQLEDCYILAVLAQKPLS